MRIVLLLFIAFTLMSIVSVNAGITTATQPQPVLVELNSVELQSLLAAAGSSLNAPASDLLSAALKNASVDDVTVESLMHPPSTNNAHDASASLREIYATIRYTPVKLSATRTFKPIVRCVSHTTPSDWMFCQDESYTRLQTSTMKKAIFFNGDLSDKDVDGIFAFVDNASLIVGDDVWISSDMIDRIVKHEHAGERINVFVWFDDNNGQNIYLRKIIDHEGNPNFELTTYRCGGKAIGPPVRQYASTTTPPVLNCNLIK